MNGFSKLVSILDSGKTSLMFATSLLLCMLLNKVTAQTPTFCHTRGGSSIAQGSMPSSFGINPSGPYYLKVYFHVVQRSNGSGGQNPAEVQGIFDLLNADFNPHNIFFVRECDINFIKDNGIYTNGVLCDFSNYVHNDGIDIFLMADDANTQGGEANNIPSDYFFVSGSYWDPPFGSISKSRVTSHEMGHCLGLWHTFHGEEPAGPFLDCDGGAIFDPSVCLEFVDGSNGTTCGDYVQDTPADPGMGFNVSIPDCEWQSTGADPNGDPYDPDEHNVMSYTHPDCMGYFTAGQGDRMRAMIEASPVLQACITAPLGAITHVNTNTIYDTDMDMPGDIHVHSGAELLIEAKIGMRQGTRILVERNARLVINNGGVVTKGCDAPDWTGIQVLGNNQKVQPEHNAPLTDPNQAGVIWIDNGTVEWARTGATAGGGYGPEFWGGVIWTNNNAVFQKNRKDVEFMQYKFALNKSRFKNTRFLAGLPTVPWANREGITIWETDGIEFDNCDIYSKGMHGIRTYDAGIKVHNGCDLESNQIGISCYATYPMSYKSVIGTTAAENNFYGNQYDVYASTVTGWFGLYNPDGKFSMDVINNNFEGSRYGVVLDGPSNFRIGGNKFVDVEISAWTANTGFNNVINQNLIGCNRIDARRNIGILAIGENKEMQFLGNDFIGGHPTARDFVLTNSFFPGNNGSIRALQGNVESPADNCFSDPGVQIDIVTSGTTDFFTYYYESSEPLVDCDPEPLTMGNYAKNPVPGTFTVDCSKFGGLPDGLESPTDGDLNTKSQQLQTLAPSIQTDANAKVQYYQILAEKEAILKYLVSEALDEMDYATAESLLAGEQSKAAQWAIFGLRMGRQDYAGATQLLNQLPTVEVADAQFRDIQLINLQRLQNPTGFELSAAQEAYLNSVADGYSPIRGYARGILGLLKDRVYFPDEYEILDERSNPTERITTEALKVYPVPASDQLVVTWPSLSESTDAQIQVFDLLGRPHLSQSVGARESNRVLGVVNLPEGVYFLVISDKGKVAHRAKFTVQH